MTEEKMETEAATSQGIKVSDFYRFLREQRRSIFPDVDVTYDVNAEVVLSQIINAWSSRFPKIPETIMLWNGTERHKTALSKEQKAALMGLSTLSQPDRKFVTPLIASTQIMLKTRDDVLYQKNSVTSTLGLSPWAEAYAHGKLVKNRLKKSKPKSIGVLNHVLSMRNLASVPTSKLPDATKAKIMKDRAKSLKAQLVGNCQKTIVDQMAAGDFSQVPLLTATLPFIKPRMDHQFVLHPSVMFGLKEAELDGASFSGQWVFERTREAKFTLVHPEGKVHEARQVVLFMTFQAMFEDLNILNWMFREGTDHRAAAAVRPVFTPRETWGQWDKKKVVATVYTPPEFVYWSKPQKSAVRSLTQYSEGQIATIPSFRGRRNTFNPIKSMTELIVRYIPAGTSLVEAAREECESYKAMTNDCGGEFVSMTTGQAVNAPAMGGHVLFYGKESTTR